MIVRVCIKFDYDEMMILKNRIIEEYKNKKTNGRKCAMMRGQQLSLSNNFQDTSPFQVSMPY